MALPFGLEWSDIRAKSCCCSVIPDSCSDCEQDTELPCMRVRHVDWDETIPSLWVRLGANNGLTGYCGEAEVSDQIGNGMSNLGLWSFDFVDTAETPGYLVCNCETVFSSTLCTREVPEGWISRFTWEAGPSCNTNLVSFEGGVFTGGEYSTGVLFEKYLPAKFWESEFQVGNWVFTPAASCGLNGNGPTCFRVLKTVGDAFDVYCDIAATHGPASWAVLRCSVSSLEEYAYNLYGWQAGDGASAGYLLNSNGSATQVVVSWVINADRDTVRLMVEEIEYFPGMPGWGVNASAYIEFAYTANWWMTGRAVGDYTVGVCVENCDNEDACWPDLCPCLVDGSTDPATLYRTIYADVSGDHTETELALSPAGDRYQWTRGGDAITILCMNGGVDSYMVTVILGVDSYFCAIPANGLACDGGQLVDETISCGGITIRLYTL